MESITAKLNSELVMNNNNYQKENILGHLQTLQQVLRHISRRLEIVSILIFETPIALTWKECLTFKAEMEAAAVRTCACFESWFLNQSLTTKAVIQL